MKTGKLYGIGVGPGDPELLTLKAVRVLNEVDIVFTASSTKNNYSLAFDIVKLHLSENAVIKTLSFPMVKDENEKQTSWEKNASVIINELKNGRNAAFITLGDPMTYSTFGYLLKQIRQFSPDIEIESVPGITSYQAAASRMVVPLVEGEETLLITSGAYGGNGFRRSAGNSENIVFLKAYKHMQDITQALEEAGMIEGSTGISNCCRPDEEIISDIREFSKRDPDYWTLIISKQAKKNGKSHLEK